MLPHPELFELHPQFHVACTSEAGGGILLPEFLNGAVKTNDALDAKVAAYIRAHYSFEPSMEYVLEKLTPEQFLSWPELLSVIPQLLTEQVRIITG